MIYIYICICTTNFWEPRDVTSGNGAMKQHCCEAMMGI